MHPCNRRSAPVHSGGGRRRDHAKRKRLSCRCLPRMGRGRWWIWLLLLVGVPFALLFGLAVVVQLTCPKGADCSIDPTEQSMGVRILNDTPHTVVVDQMSCPPDSCEHEMVAAGRSAKAGTSDRGVENLYRVSDQSGNVLGCFPLLYFRRPSAEPTVRVSVANQCLTITNDTKRKVLVEVRCEMDCDFEQVDALDPGSAIVVGVSSANQYRISVANGPSFWLSPGALLGYVPKSSAGATASASVSALTP